jgi:hypothetical protein
MYIMFRQTMALPIESLRPDVLIMERAERKAAVERLSATRRASSSSRTHC